MYNEEGPYFNYLHDAIGRGSIVQVRMGDARLRMAYPYEPYNEEKERQGKSKAGGPQNFYHMMVVDAFSSDAIPIHLITLEAIKMYMDKLVPDGILCIHTSNRHVDLVPVVQRVVEAIRSRAGHQDAELGVSARRMITLLVVIVGRRAAWILAGPIHLGMGDGGAELPNSSTRCKTRRFTRSCTRRNCASIINRGDSPRKALIESFRIISTKANSSTGRTREL